MMRRNLARLMLQDNISKAAEEMAAQSKEITEGLLDDKNSFSAKTGVSEEEVARRKKEVMEPSRFFNGKKWFKTQSFARGKQTIYNGSTMGERRTNAKEMVYKQEEFRIFRYSIASLSVALMGYMFFFLLLPQYVIQVEKRKRFALRAQRAAEARKAFAEKQQQEAAQTAREA